MLGSHAIRTTHECQGIGRGTTPPVAGPSRDGLWSLDILKTGFGGRQREAASEKTQAAALPTIIG